MHIYAYGSVCRGEIVATSDIDLLALVDDENQDLDPVVFTVYRYTQLPNLWSEGNPFAWHLALESRLIFAEDGIDFVRELGDPVRYSNWGSDSEKFSEIYLAAKDVLATSRDTTTFELSTIYLAVRNLAICFSLQQGYPPVFSRRAFRQLGVHSLRIDPRTSEILEDARILSTRGVGAQPSRSDVDHVLARLPLVDQWISNLKEEAGSCNV